MGFMTNITILNDYNPTLPQIEEEMKTLAMASGAFHLLNMSRAEVIKAVHQAGHRIQENRVILHEDKYPVR